MLKIFSLVIYCKNLCFLFHSVLKWTPTKITFEDNKTSPFNYCIRHIFLFIFANFASRVLVANCENIYLRSGLRLVYAILVLLDREFNHSRKCLSPDSRKIRLAKYIEIWFNIEIELMNLSNKLGGKNPNLASCIVLWGLMKVRLAAYNFEKVYISFQQTQFWIIFNIGRKSLVESHNIKLCQQF